MKQIKSLLASLTICMVLVGGIPSPDPGAYAAPASAETAGSPEEGIPEPVTGASIAETEPQEDTPPPDTGAGTAPGIQPPEATDAALDAGAASGGAEQDGSPTGGAIAPEPVSAAAVSGGGVSVLAAEERFIDLPCYTGEQEVADLDASAPWSSSDETVARLEGGKIVVGAMGTAIVTVGLEGGGTADCHVNSYWVYPQPKTSTVRPAAGVELRQWAREDGKGMTGDHVQQDARLTLLWRVDVNDRRNQYARSQSGKEGYLVDLQNVHRSAASYYKDVAVGDITFFSTFTGSIPDSYVYNEDNNWSVADAGTLGLATQSHEGFANQARVTGLAEGVSSVRATLQDDHYVASTMLCTVYTPVDSVEVTLGGRAYVYEAAADDGQVRVAQVLGAGDTATVSGECGDYWRIGESRYIKKEAAFIAPESIAIVPDEVHLETKGDLKWYQLEVEVFPSGAQFDPADVNWSIDGEDIASIDGGGIVSGIHAGEATVTAEYHGLTATCQVYVGNVAVAGLWIDPEEMFLKPGQFRRARASTAPPTAYNRSLQWSSDNPAVASVHEGTVTAHKPGKAVVTVTTSDGSNLSARCQVTVAYEIPEQVPLEPGERIGTEPDLRLTAFTGNSYTVAFDAITYKRHSGILTFNPKAEHYMLYRRLYTQGSGDYSLLKSFDMKLQTAASHKDTGIRMDEAYVYMLVVYDKKGGTVVRKETLTTGQKQQVQGLTVQAQTDREVRLSWTAQSGVGGYLVYRAVGGSEFTLIRKLVGAGTAYFTDTGLKPKTTYSYRVCSYVKERWESNGAYWKTLLNKRAGGSDTTSRLRLNLKLAKFSPSTARVGFDVVAGAKHYLLQERKGSGYTDVKVKTTSEPAGGRDWLEAPDTGSGERVFRVCAYDKKGGSKVTHEYITLRSAAVPGTTIRSVAKGRDDVTVALQWGRVNRHGITGYKVYRSTDGKEYTWAATVGHMETAMENMSIASTPPVSWVDKGVQPGKKYYYRIVPFKVEKTSTGLYSSVLCGKPSAAKSVTTRATSIVDSTMEYFRDNWGKTVNIDTTRAVQYKVMKGSGGVCDLQIHIYLEYMGDRTEIRDKRQMFIDGVTAAWGGVEVSDPSPLDFPYEGEVRFRTSVHLHERSEDDTRGQQYVQVHMGGLCPNASDEEEWVSHWYHAHSVILGWETDIIYLPTDRWVEGNPDQDFDEPSRERSYHATSGHEMGHILGLHDANRMRGIEGLAGSRLDASDETTVLHDIQRHDNIMSLPRTIPHALPNDVEMALYAYNHNGQAYRTHVYGTGNSAIRFARSDRVRSETRDLYPDELHN